MSAANKPPVYVKSSTILSYIPISHTTLDAWVEKGLFPQPLPKITKRLRLWRWSEVETWLTRNGFLPLPPHDSGEKSA